MHELGVAEAVVDIAAEQAAGRRVSKVHVRVGALMRVDPSALEFGFEVASHGTAVEGAQLESEEVPAVVRCRACAADSEVDDLPLRCVSCGGLDVEVTGGEDLRVEAIEVEETATTS